MWMGQAFNCRFDTRGCHFAKAAKPAVHSSWCRCSLCDNLQSHWSSHELCGGRWGPTAYMIAGVDAKAQAHLVWQEAVRDVLRGVLGSSIQGLISVLELVVGLVSLPQTKQDLIGLWHSGLWHLDRLETPASTIHSVSNRQPCSRAACLLGKMLSLDLHSAFVLQLAS